MMKLNRNIWPLVAFIGIALVACKEDDSDISTITSFDKFTTTVTPLVVPESDATYTIDLLYDARQIMDIHVEVYPSEASTATEGVDYDLSAHEVDVSALSGSGQIDITVHADLDPEGDETIVLHIGGLDPHGLPTPTEVLVMTIRDSIYPAAVQVAWSGDYQDSTGTGDLCDGIDVDLFLADAGGNFVGGFGGATGSCPEVMFANLPDGTYSIVVNLYENGLLGSPGLLNTPIPFEVTLFKGGVILPENSTIHYNTKDFSQVTGWTTFTPSDPDGAANVVIGTIRVSGGQVTLVNPAGADVGTL